ncbi:nucleotide-binding universal stress UspA family protein [Granulicella aggregans]|uniref:Nucleotide-binding universal stress UspA family protein n=1 Tax=Granulicella aggregans TaxID=474949 RepID=A0A7W8E2C2_9BACT|nr:hypothetical protein [Granulicella aggregans]MBB5056029.1 nucleotide-binding universal stress UspA family protein [Granulicella aggregans]
MAKELVRGAGQAIAVKGASAIKKHAKKAAKKHAAKKHAAKKHAKKAAKHAGDHGLEENSTKSGGSAEQELRRAFHHLQRASAVISLIEAESGGDLKVMLHYGIELYREASEGKVRKARAAAGLLRATEHLAMAGLYAARGVHPLHVKEPAMDDIEELGWSIGQRLAEVDPATEYGLRLHAMVFELVKRAEGSEHDPHLAWELVNGADGVCVALEAGIE